MSPHLKKFILDFLKERGHASEGISFQKLPGDGSNRVFWRITLPVPEPRFIAMANPPIDNPIRRENLAYVMIGSHLHRKKIPVPEICLYDLKRGWFILEDMGQKDLQDLVSSDNYPLPIYEKVLEHLFRLQIEGAKDFDPSWCCQTERYDRTVMRQYEAVYFREAFLHLYLGLKKEWPELEAPFNHLAETASKADNKFFLHRDFQSRNIIICKGNIGIIDWQGGRLGPLGYDLASLLIDPYADLPSRQRNEMFQSYLLLVKGHNVGWIEPFKRYFPYLAIQRNLQILGAFSYLTRIKNKQYFEAYIPRALNTLRDLLHQINDPLLSPLLHILRDL
jgi:aminoglycoside/choline kinase family phosphotransferase